MRLFPMNESLPGVIWHDNNCKIHAVLRNCENPEERHYFDECLLPVDVFHFKAKHKITDDYCNTNCNPAQWPELRKGENSSEWWFNSSAAEQVNAWVGGYQAIVQEMQVDRYNFFLDEMVHRRNEWLEAELKRAGHAPRRIPRHDLGVIPSSNM